MPFKNKLLCLLFLSFWTCQLSAQEYNEDGSEKGASFNHKGFHVGLYLGAYFANQYTAKLYDGYGFDANGNRNEFFSSFMYNKIVLQYGGYYGQQDLVAEALGVVHGDWTFTESDMPTNMRYNPAFYLGLQLRYSVDSKSAILVNINAAQLNITGNFTITTRPPSGSSQINNSIKTCAIKGVEQRLIFHVGYQHVFMSDKNISPIAEGGLDITMAKYSKNEILINDLYIDLTSDFNQPGNPAYLVVKPVGIGFGAFAGLGVNANFSDDVRVQLLYNPAYEGVNIGEKPALKFQHGVGLRIYYSF